MREGIASESIDGTESLKAAVVLRMPAVGLDVTIDDEIRLG